MATIQPTMAPERVGKKWEDDEEATLLVKIEAGETIDEIAVSLKRTRGAIHSRLRDLACRIVGQGYSFDQVARITRLSHDEIKDALARRNQQRVEKVEAQETPLSVLREIRDLLRTKPVAVKRLPGTCYRCGRPGHYSPDCYARRHVNGYELD